MKIQTWLKRNFKFNKQFIMPTAAATVFGLTVVCCNNLSYGLTVECNGKKIATVLNEEVYEQAHRLIQTEFTTLDAGEKDNIKNIIRAEVKLEPMVEYECCKSAGDVRNKIVEQSNENIVQGAGLFINDKLIGVGNTAEEINGILENILNKEKEKYGENAEANFLQKVEVLSGLFGPEDIVSIKEIENYLIIGIEDSLNYTVTEDDTISDIAEKFQITVDELLNMNSKNTPTIFVGEILKIKSIKKILDIEVTKIETSEEKIPFQVVITEDSSIKKGQEKVTQEGVEGTKKVGYKFTYVNNQETLKEEIYSEILTEAIEKHVTLGTKQEKKTATVISTNGKLVWPVPSSHRVSSYFGDNRGHQGWDIAGPIGSTIVAVKSGTVEVAGVAGRGYGIQVVINHGSGLKTRYAHCKCVNVSKGQRVEAGQKISEIGMTGQTSGAHLHTEIIENGICKNPKNYF